MIFLPLDSTHQAVCEPLVLQGVFIVYFFKQELRTTLFFDKDKGIAVFIVADEAVCLGDREKGVGDFRCFFACEDLGV